MSWWDENPGAEAPRPEKTGANPIKKNSPWPTRDDDLRNAVAAGLTTKTICESLGISRFLVIQRAAYLDLKLLDRSAARKQAWADPGKGPKHLRGLTLQQKEDYRLYRRKGFSKQKALAAIAPPPQKKAA